MPNSIVLIILSPSAQTAFLKFRTNVYYSDWFSDFPRPYGDHNHYSFMYSIFANSIDKKTTKNEGACSLRPPRGFEYLIQSTTIGRLRFCISVWQTEH